MHYAINHIEIICIWNFKLYIIFMLRSLVIAHALCYKSYRDHMYLELQVIYYIRVTVISHWRAVV